MTLAPDEHVVSAWASQHIGAGWPTAVVWVLVSGVTSGYRIDSLSADEQPLEMVALFGVSRVVSAAMQRVAEAAMRSKP